MRWGEFLRACPALASIAEQRFARDQLVMLGTLRRDGSPRISPCEIDFAGGELLLGMMWRSPKALDLLRDPRIVVHSVTCDKDGTDGDVKLSGRAIDVRNAAQRETYREAIRARIDWAPEEPEYHLFAIDIAEAAYVVFDGEGHERVMVWEPARGLREWEKSG